MKERAILTGGFFRSRKTSFKTDIHIGRRWEQIWTFSLAQYL